MSVIEVSRFTDDYEFVAPLYAMSPDELRRRDEARGLPAQRWLAERSGEAIAAASAGVRPDDRMFLQCVGDVDSYGALARAIREELGRPVYVMSDEADARKTAALEADGFETEMIAERFRIRFDQALRVMRRSWVPPWLRIEAANAVDEEQLFLLDNELRRDVPGSEGWNGNRTWFHEELTESPPFDPAAYLVAIDGRNGEYVGLVRIWRNPTGPRFGLVGVRRSYRRTTIAGVLIARALTAASQWGHDTFVTETSLSNRAVQRRLKRFGAESGGRFRQMVLK